MYRIEAIYNTYRILSVIPLHGLSCFFKTICDFLLCGEGWCWKLSDMKFICQYLLDICLHWCKSMIWYLQMIGFAWWRGHWIPTSSPFPPAPRAISQPNPPGTPQLPACQVNSRSTGEGQLQVNGWRSTPGQWMKVIEEFKVIERKTIYVPGMKIVTKFVLWICTYKLSLLKFLSYLS